MSTKAGSLIIGMSDYKKLHIISLGEYTYVELSTELLYKVDKQPAYIDLWWLAGSDDTEDRKSVV